MRLGNEGTVLERCAVHRDSESNAAARSANQLWCRAQRNAIRCASSSGHVREEHGDEHEGKCEHSDSAAVQASANRTAVAFEVTHFGPLSRVNETSAEPT